MAKIPENLRLIDYKLSYRLNQKITTFNRKKTVTKEARTTYSLYRYCILCTDLLYSYP